MNSSLPILIVIDNLLTATRIVESAKAMGVAVEVVRPVQAAQRCLELRPLLVLIDLEVSVNVLDLVTALRAELDSWAGKLVGFYPHVRTELREAALKAGLDQAWPRSALQTRLAELLRSTSSSGS